MTYAEFLAVFICIPIAGLLIVHLVFYRKDKLSKFSIYQPHFWGILTLLIFVALVYTTPWDNYLIATHVWWYSPHLIQGIFFGWAPLEEYLFFCLQTILIALWLPIAVSWSAIDNSENLQVSGKLAWGFAIVLGIIWSFAGVLLLRHYLTGTYLGFEIIWGLPPIILQIIVGKSILWSYRYTLLLTIIPVTLYLSVTDAYAIHTGIWTINPARSLHWLIGNVLPIEESIFFLLTTILVCFGMILGAVIQQKAVLARPQSFNSSYKKNMNEVIG